ncbi:Mitochondrial inner membrane protein OXA1L [Cyphellophora attinorum]|uniref:Mitochondrial inner membrane protein OXA1L n=1 Tax=Cyphellophora attinorum TaxID=1664694 RepID=A0A0N1H6K4_9EURO|nr:Mitochondrial inner membrane protein OXA1L [Phialophora attinorum]KPI37892.1 Mitochondrial inner membrane protein OXA1L [Phialophora attinorum]
MPNRDDASSLFGPASFVLHDDTQCDCGRRTCSVTMIPRAQGLRACSRSIKTIQTPTAALRGSRNYSAVSLRGTRLAGRPSQARLANAIYNGHQCRSISWSGLWSGNSIPPPGDTIRPPDDGSPIVTSEGVTSIKATHGTADTPDPSWLTAEPHKPEVLEDIQDRLLAPKDGLHDIDVPEVVERIGFMKEDLGLDFGWGPTAFFQYCIEHLHITLGLPWAVSLFAVGFMVRAALVRPQITAQKEGDKMKEIAPIMQPLREEYKKATAAGDKKEMMALAHQIKMVGRSVDFKMYKVFLPTIIQIPITYGGFRCLRNAAELPVPSFETESVLWFSDLITTDPWILPALVGLLTWRSVTRMQKSQQVNPQMASAQTFLKVVMPVVSVIFCHYQPLAVQLWFLTTSTLMAVQMETLSHNPFRIRLGLRAIGLDKPPEKVDAFGYRFEGKPVKVEGMNLSQENPINVINTISRNVSTKPAPEPEQDISFIDKAMGSVKSKVRSVDMVKRTLESKERKAREHEAQMRKREATEYERHYQQRRGER